MQIVMCLDDRNGIAFNGRRLSSDCIVCQRIIETKTGKIWMNSKSAKLFAEYSICVDEDFLNCADQSDTCFVEDLDFLSQLSRVTTITVYRWNRHYPSDVKLPSSVLDDWTLIASNDFRGNSHDMITEEKYVK